MEVGGAAVICTSLFYNFFYSEILFVMSIILRRKFPFGSSPYESRTQSQIGLAMNLNLFSIKVVFKAEILDGSASLEILPSSLLNIDWSQGRLLSLL